MRIEQQREGYEKDIQLLSSQLQKMEREEEQGSKQLAQITAELHRTMANYEGLFKKYDISEKARKRLEIDNQEL